MSSGGSDAQRRERCLAMANNAHTTPQQQQQQQQCHRAITADILQDTTR